MRFQRRSCNTCFAAGLWLLAASAHAAASGWAQYNLNVTDPQTGQPTTTYALRYIPAGLDQTKPAPVVIFFHGLGGNPNAYMFTLQPAADAANCVVIAPSSIDFGWALPGDDQTVNQSLTLLQGELSVDPLRISVSGHSAGAAFAYLYCYNSSPSFSAVFTLSAPYYYVGAIFDTKYTAPIRMYDGTLDPNYTGGSFSALQSQWTGLHVPQQSDVQSGYDHNNWPQSSMNNGFLFLVGKQYPGTLTVNSGSGSGLYAANTVVPITANAPPAGMVFDKWTGAAVANATAASTTITMPAANTTVTATYRSTSTNQSPSITSAASATPNPTAAGTSVTFSVAASDADGDTLTYSWNFGDGGSAATAGATHAYSTAGIFQATVTVSDSHGASARSTVSVTVTTAGGGTGGSGGTGGTGGTGGSGSGGSGSGIGSGGTGSGGAGGTGSAQSPFLMSVSKIQGSAKFSGGHDSCTVSGVIPGLPKLFDPTGQTLTLNLSGAALSFNLGGKGRGKAAHGTIALKLKTKRNATTKKNEFQGGDVPFAAKLKNGTWATAWGLDPNSAASGQAKNFAITLQLGSVNYAVTVAVSVSSKPNVGAKFKK